MYHDYLNVLKFDDKKRYGVRSDGGYVIGVLPNVRYDCYISCGVSNEESFTCDFLKDHSYLTKQNCFAFDGTIAHYPWQYTTEITFFRKNIDKNNDLSDIIKKYNDIFLNMDIEGGEYTWIMAMTEEQLKQFKQIVIEFHGLDGTNSWNADNDIKIACLEKLSNTHYLIHAHGNNHASCSNNIPSVIELTYVNKCLFSKEPELNDIPLPIPGLDFKNNQREPEINLNHKPFVTNLC
eukprot:6361496-Pyramimonas_sp.AAC.2